MDEASTSTNLQRLSQTPGHRESLAGIGRAFARRWPAPDEDWDEAVARSAGEDFLCKWEESESGMSTHSDEGVPTQVGTPEG